MWQDVVDLHDFYQTPLGGVTRRLLQARIRALWPDIQGQSLLGLGFATPYLAPFTKEAERVLALMPAGQGVIHWPMGQRNLVTFADETDLPFQDFSIDRVLMVHALESSEHPGDMLREAWRVLSGGGRLMVVVPSRRSVWSLTERTPFGFGQSYSAGQLSRLLRSVSFTPLQTARALHFMPLRSRAWLSGAPGWERFANNWFSGLAGAVIIEATKQLYGAKPVKAQRRAKPVLVSLPNVATGRVLPSSAAECMTYKIDPAADRQYVEEFRQKPIGHHSPGLMRLLTVMRQDPSGRQVILICRKPFREWVLGEMPVKRADPIAIESGPVFTSREEAEWEVFRRRWQKLTGEAINLPYRE